MGRGLIKELIEIRYGDEKGLIVKVGKNIGKDVDGVWRRKEEEEGMKIEVGWIDEDLIEEEEEKKKDDRWSLRVKNGGIEEERKIWIKILNVGLKKRIKRRWEGLILKLKKESKIERKDEVKRIIGEEGLKKSNEMKIVVGGEE